MRDATNGIVLLSSLAVCATMFGCASLEDRKYELCQKYRTSQAWSEYDHCSDDHFTGDYRRGWKAGYYDVLTGGDGCPPLVAPQRYWHPPAFVDDCDAGRQDWYVGFQDGAACARTVPDSHYLKLWTPSTAPMISTVSSSAPVLVPPAPDHGDLGADPSPSAADVSGDDGDVFPLPMSDPDDQGTTADPSDNESGEAPEGGAVKRSYDDDPPAGDTADGQVPEGPAAPVETPAIEAEPNTDQPVTEEPAAASEPDATTLLDFLIDEGPSEAPATESPAERRLLQTLIERSAISRERVHQHGNASLPRLDAGDGEASLLPNAESETDTSDNKHSFIREFLISGDPWLTAFEQ